MLSIGLKGTKLLIRGSGARQLLNRRWEGVIPDAKAARAARKAAKASESKNGGGNIITPVNLAILAIITASGYGIYDVQKNKEGALGRMYYGSIFESVISKIYAETFGRFKEMYFPYDDKLLPDWPTAPVCVSN